MKRYMIVDGHCDTLNEAYKRNLCLNDMKLMFNIKEAKKPYLQFLATFINDNLVIDELDNGYILGNKMIDYFYEQYNILKNVYNLKLIQTSKDIENIYNNKLGILLSTENGAIIGKDKENIISLYNRGVRVMGITWNCDNLLGCGCNTKNDTGLTSFGRDCIKLMNKLGIIVDVSHTSYNTFFNVINLADKVIATHSNVYNLKRHPRNLKDEQIKEIAKKDGVIGICFCKDFLNNEQSSINDIVKHMDYISNLVGVEYVVIGSDFDGVEKNDLPLGINNVSDMEGIISVMIQNGFPKTSITEIMGDNYISYLKKNI